MGSVEADARLIAAAPEMLAALKAALLWFDTEVFDTQRAGGDASEGTEPADEYSTDTGYGENKIDLKTLRAAIAKANGQAFSPSTRAEGRESAEGKEVAEG